MNTKTKTPAAKPSKAKATARIAATVAAGTIRQRLAEPSTWAGIAAVMASAAQAAQTKDPAAIGATVAGLVAMFTPEGRRK